VPETAGTPAKTGVSGEQFGNQQQEYQQQQ
jgi:hypothetical protein